MYGRNQQHKESSPRRAPNRDALISFDGTVDAAIYVLEEDFEDMALEDGGNHSMMSHEVARRMERQGQRDRLGTQRPFSRVSRFAPYDARDRRTRRLCCTSQAGAVDESESLDYLLSLHFQPAPRTWNGRRNALSLPSGVSMADALERTSRPAHRQRRQSQRDENTVPLRLSIRSRAYPYLAEERGASEQGFHHDDLLHPLGRPSHRQGRQSQREENMVPLTLPIRNGAYPYLVEQRGASDQSFYHDDSLDPPGR
ncbi:MAG: hypothetical protein M1816_005977 [Peltula sp. TS41687]|nr:MAG: hypothetical protein M1816_005977 [Peltula sp. TS41687]